MSVKAALLATVMAAVSAGLAHAQERVVNIYNWSDYIDPAILEAFTKETGIKTVYDVYDSNEILENKMLTGGSGYDIVVPTGDFLARQIAAGVYQPLDKSKLSNLPNMWDEIMKRAEKYDPGNKYSVPYMWGTDGIGYNVKKVNEILGEGKRPGLEVIFDPAVAAKFKDCGIYVFDSPRDVIGAALHYLGLSPDSKNPDDFAKAEALLTAVRPNIRKFHSSEYISALANGDICIAMGYSGDMLQARKRAQEAKAGVEVDYSIPSQGTQVWIDSMVMPKDAPHAEDAQTFINYMMRPDVAAKASEYVFYANANKASQAVMSKEVLEDPAIYPDAETFGKLYTVSGWDAKTQRLATRIWTKVITGQ
ncbi:spermidine/putrescine ABC transporter substrate-binding protein PotF [Xaviernesmea oryzae]|uniref:Putrescine-binding periplasmic protein n=1 Tax=Xaviernesmea oryzae TaxID=464029 RepID=A0A1Q9ARQ1_9HYPH|nr:polyamine ABC transporter substrate-binding protein [Xaviernesmea oryzae]OLP58133.1 spermidine/putrescine ABC transporter substrate-binding protein PotF [Xaviernesmea oryzae]SEL81642.1 putrescine transport system substrate-binding protein [Xaviernesmea oryzae]